MRCSGNVGARRAVNWTLITGAAKHLGATLALSLAKAGKSVCIHYNKSEKQAKQLVDTIQKEGGTAKIIQGDFSTIILVRDFLDRYLAEFSETETVIHNVGNTLIKPASETNIDEMLSLFETNLFAPFHITEKLLPTIKKHKGNILFLGVAGLNSVRAETYASIYHLTKMSLFGLTKSLAKELAPFSVRVNMISPGYLENAMGPEEAKKRLQLHRTATFEEVAKCAVYLLSEKYITGQNIEIAGGVRL